LDDWSGNEQVLGEGAVIPGNMRTERILLTLTKKAIHAGGRVIGDDSIANLPTRDTISESDNFACPFMSESSWWLEHLRMSSAPPDFEIRAAGSRGGYLHDDLTRSGEGWFDSFEAKIFLTVKEGC
jgi:hypothetical protein